MEATVIAAVVSAAGGLLEKVIEWASPKGDDDKANTQAQAVVIKAYDTLRTNFTDGCVRVLKLMESGEIQPPNKIRALLYPTLHLVGEAEEHFDGEFKYRLEYMRLNGVLTMVGGSEYGITHLGQAFLEEARKRRAYYSVLCGS